MNKKKIHKRNEDCPLCGPSASLKQVTQDVAYDFRDKEGELVEYEIPVNVEHCSNCGSTFSGSSEARDVHNFQCKILGLATLDEVAQLKQIVEKDKKLKKFESWENVATVILGISANTMHAWRRLDGMPNYQTSLTIKDLIRHPKLINERIEHHLQIFNDDISEPHQFSKYITEWAAGAGKFIDNPTRYVTQQLQAV